MKEEGCPEAQAPPILIGGRDGRQKGKNTLNNTKSNTTPETSGSIARRPEHHNTDEAEENGTIYGYMKMIKAIKEEMKNSLKEMEEKTKKIRRDQQIS